MKPIDRLMEAYERHLTELFALARSIAVDSSEAEDVMQDVMVKLLSSPEKLGHIGNLRAYLRTCVRNEAIDHIRKLGREAPTDSEVLDLLRSGVCEKEYAEIETMIWIRGILSELPRDSAEAFIAYAVDGRSIRELAREKGIKADTLRKRFDAIKKRIRDEWISQNKV